MLYIDLLESLLLMLPCYYASGLKKSAAIIQLQCLDGRHTIHVMANNVIWTWPRSGFCWI